MAPFASVFGFGRARTRPSRPAPRPTARLSLHRLEQRLAPATFNIPNGDVAAFIAAINTSNTNNQADTINLATNGTYTFTAVAAGETVNALPKVLRDTNNLANSITINGNGATLVRSSAVGTPSFRFLEVGVFPNDAALTVNNTNFTNGEAGAAADGGAILLNAGDLTVSGGTFSGNRARNGGAIFAGTTSVNPRIFSFTNVTFSNNTAMAGDGGAIRTFGSSPIVMTGSTINNNSASGSGGGISIQTAGASHTFTGTTIRNNQSLSGVGTAAGVSAQAVALTFTNSTIADNASTGTVGGIFLQGNLTVTGSTISGNTAANSTGSGGGVFLQGVLTMTNSTVHGNRAGSGGGLSITTTGATPHVIRHSTITGNRAFFTLATGAGLRTTGPLTLSHTIVAENTFDPSASGGTNPDISGTTTTATFNFVGNGTGSNVINGVSGNQVGSAAAPLNPQLGPLQNNGGPTLTRLPLPGSPVINAGDPAFAPPPDTDQRGTGFPRVQAGRVDIGATEAPPPQVDVSVSKTDNQNNVSAGGSTIYTVVVANTGPAGVVGVTFTDAQPPNADSMTWTTTAAGGATGAPANGAGSISNTLSLPAGSSVTYTVVVTLPPDANGTLTNTASVTIPVTVQDTNTANNTATDVDQIVTAGGRATAVIVGADFGGLPEVKLIDPATGALVSRFLAYDPNFRGGVRVAAADFNDDGVQDLVTAPGPMGGPHVRVFDGSNGEELFSFMAYDENFRGGAYVATGDVNGDNTPDIITGAGETGGPHVRVFNGRNAQQLPGRIGSFFAYDINFRGGVRVAAGNIDGDTSADIITGAGEGGGPHVLVWSGLDATLLQSLYPYDPAFRGGVFVAAGDVNLDRRSDIITGPGLGGGAHIVVFDARTFVPLASFNAFTPGLPGQQSYVGDTIWSSGLRVAAGDFDGDGIADIVAGPGRGRRSQINFIDGSTFAPSAGPVVFDPSFLGGVFVGAV